MKEVKMDKNFQIWNEESHEWHDTCFFEEDVDNDNIMKSLTQYSEDSDWRYYKTEESLSYSTLFRKRKKQCPNCGTRL